MMSELKENEQNFPTHIKIDPGRQGKLFVALIYIFFIFFGVICNLGTQPREINEGIIWLYTVFFEVYYGLPILLLLICCFLLTYSEDNFHYGMKSSLWLVPIIICFSIFWHWIIYGFSVEPFILLFGRYQGYLNIVILFTINFAGAFLGYKIKSIVLKHREMGEKL